MSYLYPNNTTSFFGIGQEVIVTCGKYKDHISKITKIEENRGNRIFFGNFRYKLKNIDAWIPEKYLERNIS